MRAFGEKRLWELEDVADGRGPKRIDRLRVVADNHDSAAIWLEGQAESGPEDGSCPGTRPREHGRTCRRYLASGLGILQQLCPQNQQVVVIEDILLALRSRVCREQFPQLLSPSSKRRKAGSSACV